ncbi:MAG TPA: HAMP domain-containing sensor histidine kinase [Acidiferrobacterales bacterium]|nr:HAMP domain-containing sensor histidine kinase [Acidiferrobacterales bacterium]
MATKQAKVGHLPWKAKTERQRLGENLLYLRPRVQEPSETLLPAKNGWIFALIGLGIGAALGYLQFHYHLLAISLWNGFALELAIPALLGGGLGILFAWSKAQRRLTQALVTSEGFRRRLLSVERNQALWISLSAALHDVRNPLHNVNLLIETLGTPGSDVQQVQEQVLEQLERIHVRMRHVMKQVSEFSGEIMRRPVRLRGVLDEVASMIQPMAKQELVSFKIQCPSQLKVIADPKFLVQAIDHLVLNSLHILSKQVHDKPRRLSLSVVAEESSLYLLIEDSGPGLPESVRNKLFQPVTASQPAGGMGLGLAIAHALATAAGGELYLAHTGATGTQFHLHLDRA